jgi:hypothetical protein
LKKINWLTETKCLHLNLKDKGAFFKCLDCGERMQNELVTITIPIATLNKILKFQENNGQ